MIEKHVKERVKRTIKRYEQATSSLWWEYWPVQTGFGKHGVPDCLICVHGYLVAIETKVDSKDPTTRQWINLREIELSRGISLVIDQHNLFDIDRVLNAIISGNISEARAIARANLISYEARAV